MTTITSQESISMKRALALGTLSLLVAAGMTTPAGAVPDAQLVDICAQTPAPRDLNGDRFDDAVVGDPYATVNGQAEAGSITVLFGSLDGIGEGSLRRTVTQADLGEAPEAGDHFGWSTALAPIGLLGRCAGIAVGAPGEDVDGRADAGMGHLLYFNRDSESVPTTVEAANFDQAEAGGTVEAGDELGYAVSLSEATDNGTYRVAFGAPGENVGSTADAGAVNVIRIAAEPRALGELRQGKALPGGSKIPDTPETGDRFGSVLVDARLDLGNGSGGTDRQSTLLIGTPGDTVSGRDGAGSVTAVREKLDGAVRYTQNTAGVAGTAEVGDRFGESLAVSLRLGNITRRVAIGVPGEDLGSTADAGSIAILIEFEHTLRHLISGSQATPRVAGTAEADDNFGQTVAFWGSIELAVGAPGEDVGAVVDAGAAQFLWVSGYLEPHWNLPPLLVSSELVPTVTEDTPGTPGVVLAGSRFGSSLTGFIGLREESLAIGSPFQNGGSVFVIDWRNEVTRAWQPGTGGIGGVGVQFGQSIS